jgi:hypothetical protein
MNFADTQKISGKDEKQKDKKTKNEQCRIFFPSNHETKQMYRTENEFGEGEE